MTTKLKMRKKVCNMQYIMKLASNRVMKVTVSKQNKTKKKPYVRNFVYSCSIS